MVMLRMIQVLMVVRLKRWRVILGQVYSRSLKAFLILLNLDLHDPIFMISSRHSRYPADYNCKHNTRSSDTQHVRCLCYLR